MSALNPKGSPDSPIWIVCEKPYEADVSRGYIFSGTMGWIFDKIFTDAGLPTPFITALSLDPEKEFDEATGVSEFVSNNSLALGSPNLPSLLVPLGERATVLLSPETQKRTKKKGSKALGSLDKWAGSLLTSPYLNFPHYVIPTYAPDFVASNYWYRDIQVNIDLGHVKEEYEYLLLNNCLQSLPARELITQPSCDGVCHFLQVECLDARVPYVSVDIETIRPTRESKSFKGHAGYPYTISLATSPYRGISFSFWDYETEEIIRIWKLLDAILRTIPQIGQNYFSFDAHWLESMGFTMCLPSCHDTMIRHHTLWPELSHKLQFLTRQYTRQPYYKDEGKGWSPKHKKSLMRYNALDTTVTFEVFLEQEKEFDERPYLR